MDSILQGVHQVLDGVPAPLFAVSGRFPNFRSKAIHVDGIGAIECPISHECAKKLINAASHSPFGKGSETLVNKNVRNSFQIDASKIKINDQQFSQLLNKIVSQVVSQMGASHFKTKCELYKMLIYEAGGFFLPQKDTEKCKNMYATLVLSLPCAHEGDALIVRQADEMEVFVDFDCSNSLNYTAFYADCEHEVKPLKSGYRVALVYNLINTGIANDTALREEQRERISNLTSILQKWNLDNTDRSPLIHLLEHSYTPASLSMPSMKGKDAVSLKIVDQACKASGFSYFLCLVKFEATVSDDNPYDRYDRYHRYGRYGYGYEEKGGEEDDEQGYGGSGGYNSNFPGYDPSKEVILTEAIASHLVPDNSLPDGIIKDECDYELNPDHFTDQQWFESKQYDNYNHSEYTGNAGASVDYTYNMAAIIILKPSGLLSILEKIANPNIYLTYLNSLQQDWEKHSKRFKPLEIALQIIEAYSQVHTDSAAIISQIYHFSAQNIKQENDILQVLTEMKERNVKFENSNVFVEFALKYLDLFSANSIFHAMYYLVSMTNFKMDLETFNTLIKKIESIASESFSPAPIIVLLASKKDDSSKYLINYIKENPKKMDLVLEWIKTSTTSDSIDALLLFLDSTILSTDNSYDTKLTNDIYNLFEKIIFPKWKQFGCRTSLLNDKKAIDAFACLYERKPDIINSFSEAVVADPHYSEIHICPYFVIHCQTKIPRITTAPEWIKWANQALKLLEPHSVHPVIMPPPTCSCSLCIQLVPFLKSNTKNFVLQLTTPVRKNRQHVDSHLPPNLNTTIKGSQLRVEKNFSTYSFDRYSPIYKQITALLGKTAKRSLK